MKLMSEIARLTGVSNSTLRLYEQKGLIEPVKDESNGYRSFNVSDIGYLTFLRKCKPYGFTLDEVKSLFDSSDLSDNLAIFKNRLHHLQDEIENLKKVESFMREEVAILEQAVTMKNTPFIDVCPGIYRIDFFTQEKVFLRKRDHSLVTQWLSIQPYRWITTVVPKDVLLSGSGDIWSGVGLQERFIHEYSMDTSSPLIQYTPPQKAVCAFIQSRRDNSEILAALRPFLTYIEDNGFSLCGDIIMHDFAGLKNNHQVFWKVWLPIIETT